MIELKHITKLYGNFKALDDINLSIKDGEIFGIVGPSGSGKSTLIRCVNMLEPPTSGEVLIDGKDMTKLSKSQLREERKKIGMIFQHFNLLSNRTVAGNVAFPLELSNVPKSEQKKRIDEILELMILFFSIYGNIRRCYDAAGRVFAGRRARIVNNNLSEGST